MLWHSCVISEKSTALEVTPVGFNRSGEPFTGLIYNFHQNGRPAKVAFFSNGKRQGPEWNWYDNGRLWIERHYSAGVEVKTHRAWYPDGSVMFIKHFVQGKAHGDFLNWHPNGTLSQFIHFELGTETVAKSWTAKGKPFYNYLWRNGEHVGIEGDSFCSLQKKI